MSLNQGAYCFLLLRVNYSFVGKAAAVEKWSVLERYYRSPSSAKVPLAAASQLLKLSRFIYRFREPNMKKTKRNNNKKEMKNAVSMRADCEDVKCKITFQESHVRPRVWSLAQCHSQ